MVWPDYIGLDPEPARVLADLTSSWSGSVDSILRKIQAAETLTGEPVGVHLALDEVAVTGRLVGTAVTRAVNTVESYRVPTLGTYWRNQLLAGSVDQTYRREADKPARLAWQAPAQDGLVPGGPDARVELPQLDMSEANKAIARLAAEVERLNGSVEAGVAPNSVRDRHVTALAELNALARTVTTHEAAALGVTAGTWVDRDIAATAGEWQVPYDEATLLHRRREILAEEPTVEGHRELIALGAALGALHNKTGEAEETASAGFDGRLSAGAFDGFVAERPESLDDPASLSNEALVLAIENWDGGPPGINTTMTIAALIAERDARAGASGLGSEQRQILTTAFTRDTLGQLPRLVGNDAVDNPLVEHLLQDGYSLAVATQLAAIARAQFPGDDVAAYRGIVAALEADAVALGTQFNQVPSAADFQAFAVEQGQLAVHEFRVAFVDAMTSTFDIYTEMAGEPPSTQLLIALADHAIRNGLSFGQVTRRYLGINASTPPAGWVAAQINEPEIVEIRAIIEQHVAVLEAMTGQPAVANLVDNAHWLWQRHRPDSAPTTDAFAAAMSGGLDNLFGERAAIDAFVASSMGPLPSPELLEAQEAFIDRLDALQLAVSLQGANHFDPLGPDQVDVVHTLESYQSDIVALFNPAPTTYEDLRDPFQPRTEFLPPISISEIERLLALHNGPGGGTVMAHGLASALQQLLDDPDLVEALAPHHSDLHAAPTSLDAIDFLRLPNAVADDLLANLTSPWADDIDAFKSGQEIDGKRVRTDWSQWADAAESDPAVPRLVVDAARAVIAAGLYDASALDTAHVALALVALLPIPILQQVAGLIDAGLYYAVDEDPVAGSLALGGAALSGLGSFTAWRVNQADELTQLVRTANTSDELATLLHGIQQGDDLAGALDGLDLSHHVGRKLDELHMVDDLGAIVDDLDQVDDLDNLARHSDAASTTAGTVGLGWVADTTIGPAKETITELIDVDTPETSD